MTSPVSRDSTNLDFFSGGGGGAAAAGAGAAAADKAALGAGKTSGVCMREKERERE